MNFPRQLKEFLFPEFSKLDFLNISLLLLCVLVFTSFAKTLFFNGPKPDFEGILVSAGICAVAGYLAGIIIQKRINPKEWAPKNFVFFLSFACLVFGFVAAKFVLSSMMAITYLFVMALPLYFFVKNKKADVKQFSLMYVINLCFYCMFSLFSIIFLLFYNRDALGALFSLLVFLRLFILVKISEQGGIDDLIETKGFDFYSSTSASKLQVFATLLFFFISFYYGKMILKQNAFFISMFCLSMAPILQTILSPKSLIITILKKADKIN